MRERRKWNPERHGHVEAECWSCGQPIQYFSDEDGTPQGDIRPSVDALAEALADEFDGWAKGDERHIAERVLDRIAERE